MPQARTMFVLWARGSPHEGVPKVHLEGHKGSGCYGYTGSLNVGLCFLRSKKIDCDSHDAQPGSHVEPKSALTKLHLNVSALSDPYCVSLLPLNISDVSCLLDSGSTHCFIDSSFIKKHKITTNPIPLILLFLLDGSSSSSISSTIDLRLAFTLGETTSEMFYITTLDSSCMIVLGHYCLTCYNPLIDPTSSIAFQPSAAGMPTLTSPSESSKLNSVLPPLSSNPLPQARPGLASHPLETPPSD